jgi:hypothetical protein
MPKGNFDRDPLDDVLRPPLDETNEERSIRLRTEEKAKRVSDAIDVALRQERQAARKKDVVRLLLLGQSESGALLLSLTLSHTAHLPDYREIHDPQT